jgi:hypothetical protein
MVFDYGKNSGLHLSDVLWAYWSSPKTATGFSPFLLVYGTEAIAPVEIAIPTPHVVQGTKNDVDASMCTELRTCDLEALEETRNQALEKTRRYHLKMVGAYGKIVKERIFATGQLVLKAADYVRRGLPSPSKFASNWEGPYMIREAHASGYYKLAKADGTVLMDPVNGKWLKYYYSEWEVVEILLCLDSRGRKPFVFILPAVSRQGYISHGRNSFVLTLFVVPR